MDFKTFRKYVTDILDTELQELGFKPVPQSAFNLIYDLYYLVLDCTARGKQPFDMVIESEYNHMESDYVLYTADNVFFCFSCLRRESSHLLIGEGLAKDTRLLPKGVFKLSSYCGAGVNIKDSCQFHSEKKLRDLLVEFRDDYMPFKYNNPSYAIELADRMDEEYRYLIEHFEVKKSKKRKRGGHI